MAGASTQRDPRSVVTPDALEVADDLFGLRLASPRRRLAALFLDLVLIGFLAFVTQSVARFLWVGIGVLLIRAGFKRTPVRGSVFGRAMRFSVGCLGVFVVGITVLVWMVFGFGLGDDDPDDGPSVVIELDGDDGLGALGSAAELTGSLAFADAESIDEAAEVAEAVIAVAEGLEMETPAIRELLLASVPDDAEWAEDAPALFDELLGLDRPPALESREAAAIADEVSLYTTAEALAAYAQLLESGRDGEMDEARRVALRARLAEDVAGDSLGALEGRIEELAEEDRRRERQLRRVEEDLEQATSGGLLSGLMDFLDELGFGFGWATVYMTVMLSWWKGQTPGKRLLGIRVVRLDGEPITWWVAFERVGGYAAGFATGLLGFAQVYWDSNRQAIHDRIVGTVVVMDKAERVPDWESAL